MTEQKTLTDLELLVNLVEAPFIDPVLFKEAQKRGIVHFSNNLPSGKEGKAILYARLARAKKVVGDPEIDQIMGKIEHLQRLQKKLVRLKVEEADVIVEHSLAMAEVAQEVLDYFKDNDSKATA